MCKRMNILLCGHGGALCRQLVQRFSQEKHSVYLLTGSTQDDVKDIKAFQTYPFSYSNDNLSRIMKSSAADVLVIEGAYDPLYDWRNATKQSVRFLSDLTSILAGAKAAGISRMVFLSALKVEEYLEGDGASFADANEREIYRALSSGEDLIRSYEDEDFKATVLRLPPVFGGCDASYGVGSVCRRMAEQYLWDHEVRYSANETHREIFYPDAAKAVRRVVRQQDISPLLQVAGIEFSEQEFVEALKATGIVDESVLRLQDEGGSSLQTEKPIQHELEVPLKYTVTSAARSLVEELQKCREQDAHNQRKDGLFWHDHLLPIAESIGLFAVTFGIMWLIRGTWVAENLNLFYIYVLLIGVTWGMAHSLFASLLAGVATFFLTQESTAYLSLDYGYFVQLLELVVVGVTGGFMRDKYFRRNQDLRDEKAFYVSEVHDLTRINESNNYVRNLFEKRLMGYQNSLAKIYEITSQLDLVESRKLIFHAVRVLSQIMDTPHVAIYVSSSSGGFFRLAAASSPLARQMGKSIRYFDFEKSILYQALSHREIYQNRNMKEGYPTFAGAVYRSDSPAAIVMVWMENIEQVNLYSSNLLAILCRLLESSVHRAVQFEELAYKDVYLPGTRILKEAPFLQTLETFEEGRRQGLFEYLLFHVKSDKNEWEHIEQLVRDTDVLGEIHDEIYVVLSNSDNCDAQVVAERLATIEMELEEVTIPAGDRSDTDGNALSSDTEAVRSGDGNAA